MVTREYPPYSFGGMSVVVAQMAKLLPDFGISLTIIAPDPDSHKIVKERSSINPTIYRVPLIGDTFLTKVPSFAYFASKLVRQLQHDHELIYSHGTPLFCETMRPLLAHFHGTRYGEYLGCKALGKTVHAFLNRLYIPFDRYIINQSQHIIALSTTMVVELHSMVGETSKIKIVPNGVDTSIFSPEDKRNFHSPKKRVLFTGRLDARKGLVSLFYAFKKVSEKLDTTLTIIGDGREKPKLKRLAENLEMPVTFIEKLPQSELKTAYCNADLFILPSLYEPFGMVAVEAMACGTPVIVSSACPEFGVPRFPIGDIEALAKLMLDLLGSEETQQEWSERSLEISKNYRWSHIASEIATIMQSMVTSEEPFAGSTG